MDLGLARSANAQAGSIWLPTLALGALQRLAGSTWLLTNAPTTAPSTRVAKKYRCAAERPASTLPASLALQRFFHASNLVG